MLGISLFTFRFEPYLLLVLVALGSTSLATLTRQVFANWSLQSIFVATVLLASGVGLWQEAAVVYNYYESPSRYGRVHRDELAAIAWLDTNLPSGHIVSTSINRHSEWIPVLSDHTWESITEGHDLFHEVGAAQDRIADKLKADAVIFFGRREPVSANFKEHGRLLYDHGKVTIYDLR